MLRTPIKLIEIKEKGKCPPNLIVCHHNQYLENVNKVGQNYYIRIYVNIVCFQSNNLLNVMKKTINSEKDNDFFLI